MPFAARLLTALLLASPAAAQDLAGDWDCQSSAEFRDGSGQALQFRMTLAADGTFAAEGMAIVAARADGPVDTHNFTAAGKWVTLHIAEGQRFLAAGKMETPLGVPQEFGFEANLIPPGLAFNGESFGAMVRTACIQP